MAMERLTLPFIYCREGASSYFLELLIWVVHFHRQSPELEGVPILVNYCPFDVEVDERLWTNEARRGWAWVIEFFD